MQTLEDYENTYEVRSAKRHSPEEVREILSRTRILQQDMSEEEHPSPIVSLIWGRLCKCPGYIARRKYCASPDRSVSNRVCYGPILDDCAHVGDMAIDNEPYALLHANITCLGNVGFSCAYTSPHAEMIT